MNKNPITTHILDTSQGKPAANVAIQLFVFKGDEWTLLSDAITNQDGRIEDWQDSWYQNMAIEQLFGTYKIVFALDPYWETQSTAAFYPSAEICFRLQDERHHHIPLLLTAYGYSTYRGS
tara:strand:- start:4231 stop:4590 length:360 start_codon:yes stop_codon:yes gene_type:complete